MSSYHGLLGTISTSGIRVIESLSCYDVKTIVYGIADTRRPNNKKPLYRRKTIRIPTGYIVNGCLVCHPEWRAAFEKKIVKQMRAQIEEQERNLIFSMFK